MAHIHFYKMQWVNYFGIHCNQSKLDKVNDGDEDSENEGLHTHRPQIEFEIVKKVNVHE